METSLGFVVTFLVGLVALGVVHVPTRLDSLDLRPSATQRILRSHDCWSRRAPTDMAGVLPGHVVVSVHGRPARYSARLVGPALAQVFQHEDRGLAVYAFCR